MVFAMTYAYQHLSCIHQRGASELIPDQPLGYSMSAFDSACRIYRGSTADRYPGHSLPPSAGLHAEALQQMYTFMLHQVSVVCRGPVSEPAEAAGDLQLVLRPGAQPPPQAGLQARQPPECAHVVAVCRRGGAETDQVPGLQLAPV